MKELKIYLGEELNDRFRKAAMASFGYGRGSISKAAEEAILQWCERKETVEDSAASLVTSSQESRGEKSESLGQGATTDPGTGSEIVG